MKPYYEYAGITIYHGDCREILPLADGADLCVTDPPYRSLDIDVIRGTTTRLVGRGNAAGRMPNGNRLGHKGDWFGTMPAPELTALLLDLYARIALTGALYVFADVKTGLDVFPALPQKNVLVWDKQSIGMGYSWRRMHEWIAYCPKPDHELRSKARGDILRCRGIEDKQHPTEKPPGVIAPLLLNSSDEGALVFDPFMGSGTTLFAAKAAHRRAIGIEIEERYCEIAAKRLSQEVLAL